MQAFWRIQSTVKIAGQHDCAYWRPISERLADSGEFAGDEPGPDWQAAFDVIGDRIDSRFLKPARILISSGYEYAGFAVLAIDAVVIETIQRVRKGLRNVEGESRNLVTDFLRTAPSFSRYFPEAGHVPGRECPCRACDFYRNVRSGVAH